MKATDQSQALVEAIRKRANALAEEHLAQAERAVQRIQRDSLERLRLMEEKEILLAKAKAEREFRRIVQAREIRMQSELDRLRWGLVQSVLESLRLRLAEIHDDPQQYPALLEKLLAEAAAAIERDELSVRLCDRDYRGHEKEWEELAGRVAPDKALELSSNTHVCGGGVIVESRDGRITIDNTFQGRVERMESELYRVILERLFPSTARMEVSFNG